MTLAVKVALNPQPTNQPTVWTMQKQTKRNITYPVLSTMLQLYSLAIFLAPLAGSHRASVMVLCPSYVCSFVRSSSGHPFVSACVRKSFLLKTSPQKLLKGFLLNFTGKRLRWSSFKFLQKAVFHEEFWLPWQPK